MFFASFRRSGEFQAIFEYLSSVACHCRGEGDRGNVPWCVLVCERRKLIKVDVMWRLFSYASYCYILYIRSFVSDIPSSPKTLRPLLLNECIFGPSTRLSAWLMSCLSVIGSFVSLTCLEKVCASPWKLVNNN